MSLIPSSSIFSAPRTNIFDPFSLDVWDPFYDFPLAGSALTAAPGFGLSRVSDEVAQLANTRIDWRETSDAHIFQADLPGIRKEEVKVEVEEGGVLRISGQRSRELEEKGDTWHRLERSSGSFLRRFRLPDNARLDQVKASMEHGVLTVTVPKVVATPPAVRAVEISG